MKLSQFNMVTRHVEERRKLLWLLDAVNAPDKLHVTIDGQRMDMAAEAVARPAIVTELGARVCQIDLDLKHLGVVVD